MPKDSSIRWLDNLLQDWNILAQFSHDVTTDIPYLFHMDPMDNRSDFLSIFSLDSCFF